jgi:hypothetical protein
MNTAILPSIALLSAFLAAGCGRASPLCSADPAPAPSAVLLHLPLSAAAGDTKLALGAPMTSATGVQYDVSMLRFYVSRLHLVDAGGAIVPAVLADGSGQPLEYGVSLVDFARPETRVLHVLAPPGRYTALSVSIGVPSRCDGEGTLNHENAAAQSYPLDVDADMYWGWNPGYVFFKIEGHVRRPEGRRPFVFHVGDDKRFMTLTVPGTLELTASSSHGLTFDLDRLFTRPTGETLPDLTGSVTSNMVHGGKEADTLADNIAHSGVLTWNE